MTCSAYWSRIVRTEITPKYPNTNIAQARRYDAPRDMTALFGEGAVVPGVTRDPGDPVRQLRKVLKQHYDPNDFMMLIQYHPAGGVSWLVMKKPPAK